METRIIKETFADGSTGIYIQAKKVTKTNYQTQSIGGGFGQPPDKIEWEYLDKNFNPTHVLSLVMS